MSRLSYPRYFPAENPPEHWRKPEGGSHGVAIESSFYEACADEIDNFFGRRLDKWTHNLTLAGTLTSYVIFTFKEKADADQFAFAFEGEPMNPGDKGRGKNWMYWYPGRSARQTELAMKQYGWRMG